MPAVLLHSNSIIACAKAIQDVQLEDMGCSVGEYNINALEREDKMCIRKSEKRIEILHENKESSSGRSEKEEGKAGKNKLWMRKVQPAKLGPSQQLLVNILLGKWLEMCSFWTKFTSKSCPNLTHRLTLLHDFSVVVGQTPTKIYIFGNSVSLIRRSGQSVTASDFGSNGPRFESGRGRCVESLDKALYSHCPKEKPSH